MQMLTLRWLTRHMEMQSRNKMRSDQMKKTGSRRCVVNAGDDGTLGNPGASVLACTQLCRTKEDTLWRKGFHVRSC